MNDNAVLVRSYFPGMGEAIAKRTVNRLVFSDEQRMALPSTLKLNPNDPLFVKWMNAAELSLYPVEVSDKAKFMKTEPDLRSEIWADVAKRVAEGNVSLTPDAATSTEEFERMHKHMARATLLMSGRHLQHGDARQKMRPQEVFTNCFDHDTRILTMEYGPIEIGKIANETVTVIAGDGVPRKARINEHGEQDLFEITFRSHKGGGGKYRKSVRATADHRWVLRDGSVTTSLKKGDVLKAIAGDFKRDPEGVIHGLIYGDGSAHKGRRDAGRPGVSVGRTYASIRVCKQDAVRDEIHATLDAAGYKFSTPAHADGDRVYYIGKLAHAKELPFTKDPEYIAGFIYGWWLADGSKSLFGGTEISTANELAAEWLLEHAGYAGLNVTMHRTQERKEGDGSFENGKSLHTIRVRQDVEWVVESIEAVGRGTVYCPEEPVTSSFVLANGLLTGNCSTSAFSFITLYLLLNGSGVGSAYDDAIVKTDFGNLPEIHVVIAKDYEDRAKTDWEWDGDAQQMVQRAVVPNVPSLEEVIDAIDDNRPVTVFKVPDSRGGWAKAVEIAERMAFEGRRDEILILDFSDVRPMGSPIRGMQNRPSSGPGPLMKSLLKIALIRDMGLEPWEAKMHVDHWLAVCVLVGGARRAARMATKRWDDPTVFGFISFKKRNGFWSSNNSVTIDEEFRSHCRRVSSLYATHDHDITDPAFAVKLHELGAITDRALHAWRVLFAIADSSYHGSGEPGVINQDRLHQNDEGVADYIDGLFAQSKDFAPDAASLEMLQAVAKEVAGLRYTMITNPCGEIALLMLGGYCVIADVVPFHAANDDDAEDAFRVAVRALMRTNTMNCLYGREVKRTNRIGVGITGFHEWAYARFGFSWYDIIDEAKSKSMWMLLSKWRRAITEEAEAYAKVLGVAVPHTNTTFKPAGTTSKLFGLSEGAHLPSMRWFMRWVQFRNDDPIIAEFAAKGYPVKVLKEYAGTTVVGFPTAPAICDLGDGEWVVTAAEATPEEQYQYLRLLEKYWIKGVDENGEPLEEDRGNQISYTLKYDPKVVSFADFFSTMIDGQFSIRCCSVMPQTDTDDTDYEYLPEEPITHEAFRAAVAKIETGMQEEVGFEHVDCASGGCPVDFKEDV